MKKFFASVLLILAAQDAWAKPQRIISLSPALTEIIFALGKGENLVGVSEYSDFPPQARKIKSVGAYTQPNMESIIALKPDLVFVPLEGPEDVKTRLEQLKIKYSVISMRKLKEIGLAAEKIAEELEAPQIGVNFKRKWDEETLKAFKGNPFLTKTVFIEVQKDPLIAAGKETFFDEIVTACGARNIVTDKNYPKISLEIPTAQNIDVVLLADHFDSSDELKAAKRWWQNQAHPPHKIEALNADITARPGPRLIEGIKMICKILR